MGSRACADAAVVWISIPPPPSSFQPAEWIAHEVTTMRFAQHRVAIPPLTEDAELVSFLAALDRRRALRALGA